MELINCKNCGKLFSKKLRDICDECLEKDNRNIDNVEKYVRNSSEQFISYETISRATGIKVEEIAELYKKGRLTVLSGRLIVKCKICGVEVKGIQGKVSLCAKCLSDVMNNEEGGTRKPILDPQSVNVDLRKFDKDIIHTNKVIPPGERMKYGFKKSFE